MIKGKRISEDEIFFALVHRAAWIKKLLLPVAPEDAIIGLEIGVYKGELLLQLVTQMPKIKKLYGIDPWVPCRTCGRKRPQKWWNDVWMSALEVQFLQPKITLIRGKSQDVIDQVPSGLHFAEIDGDHSYPQVRIDLEICERKLIKGGLLCGHDYFGGDSAGVRKAVDEFAKIKSKEVLSIGEDIGMWWWYK